MDKVTIDGVEFFKVRNGNKHVVVLDRGWVFVGELEKGEKVHVLRNASNVRNWKGGLTAFDSRSNLTLDTVSHPVEFRTGSEIFLMPLPEAW